MILSASKQLLSLHNMILAANKQGCFCCIISKCQPINRLFLLHNMIMINKEIVGLWQPINKFVPLHNRVIAAINTIISAA